MIDAPLTPARDGLVVFTPLPPLENGIADYSAELLPVLALHRPVIAVIDDFSPEPPALAGVEILRLGAYEDRRAALRTWPHVYQLGNNRDHGYALLAACRTPGVVVVHDASLHHLVDCMTLRWGDVRGYTDMLELEFGHAGRLLGRQFEERRWRGRSVFTELPMTRELLARSRAAIVHSFYAATRVFAQSPATPVSVIPHHLAPAAAEAAVRLTRTAARAALGLGNELVLVSLGFAVPAKQIDTVLHVLAARRKDLPPFRYVIAGKEVPDQFDLRGLIVRLGLDDVVSITGYVDEPAFYRYVAAADIVVNLRYPSGGETSGTLIRALGMGACVVVNDIGPFAELPDAICAKVQMTTGNHDLAFERTLLPLIAAPSRRRALGAAAARYMRQTHSVKASADAYWRVIRANARRGVEAGTRDTGRVSSARSSCGTSNRRTVPACPSG